MTISGSFEDSMVRIGTGSGIEGQWTSSNGAIVQISAGTVIVTPTWADNFMANWADFGSDFITAQKTTSNSVTLTGNSTQEIVTITWNSVGDATYSSNQPQHAAGVEYYNPADCPNDPPAWVEAFVFGTAGAAKKALSKLPSDIGGFSAHHIKKWPQLR